MSAGAFSPDQHFGISVQEEGQLKIHTSSPTGVIGTVPRPEISSCAGAPSCYTNPIFSKVSLSFTSISLADPPRLVSPFQPCQTLSHCTACNMYTTSSHVVGRAAIASNACAASDSDSDCQIIYDSFW